MSIGPVEYVLIAFPGNQFKGEIVPALTDLVESGTVRIIDVLFVKKDTEGNVSSFEYDALDDTVSFAEIPGEVGGLLGEDDVASAADLLEPDSSAALIVWEDAWAAPFAVAVRNAGGVIVGGERIPHEIVQEFLEEVEVGA